MSVNYIDQITDTGGTTHYVAEGVDTRIFRATCSTAAATTAKVATLDDSTNFSLTAGVKVAVTFTYGNSATTPTLNVNSSGAKTIAIPSSETAYTTGNGTTYNTWGAYETVLFTYTGTYWINEGSSLGIYKAYSLADSNALPSQTGNAGKYLTTDGSAASWNATTDVSSMLIDNTPTASSTNLVTSGGIYSFTTGLINRTTAVNQADTNYGTIMARGIYAGTADLTENVSSLTSGVIYIYYE